MENITVTSEPSTIPAKKAVIKKRRKRRTPAQMARARQKAAKCVHAPEPEKVEEAQKDDRLSQIEGKQPEPVGPSPAVLALQSQVVELVNQRSASRQRLTEAHTVYLMAQGRFQATQGELQGIEQEVQYRISLIAQLENRAPQTPVIQFPAAGDYPLPVTYPATMGVPAGISSEPTPQQSDPRDMVNRGHAAAMRAQI